MLAYIVGIQCAQPSQQRSSSAILPARCLALNGSLHARLHFRRRRPVHATNHAVLGRKGQRAAAGALAGVLQGSFSAARWSA